jgi:signal transduction histidine kinase
VDQASGFITKSIIAVPLQLQGSVIGVVEAVNKLNGAEMSWDDVEILSMVATQAAIAIHNAKLLSELQTAYDELNELDSMKSEFISIAAHELRTPLALILGYAAFLKDDSSGQAREQAEAVLQSAMRLRSLIDDMISLREVDTGEAVLELEHVSLQDLITAAIREIGYIAEAKEQEITLSQPADPILVEMDRNKMTLVIVNLISNAIKFTGHGGRLGVLAGTKGDTAWFTVWDTGIGIPQDELDRIFDRFYQVENSLTRHYEGMGLGLSIIREMVELHQGNIRVESQVGEGSAFTVTIPLSQSD